MAFRTMLSPNRRKIMTASTVKAVVYPVMNQMFVPLKVNIIRSRAAIPSKTPMIVIG